MHPGNMRAGKKQLEIWRRVVRAVPPALQNRLQSLSRFGQIGKFVDHHGKGTIRGRLGKGGDGVEQSIYRCELPEDGGPGDDLAKLRGKIGKLLSQNLRR